jgi:ribose-phosphate pyrophosphokinase
VLSGGASARIAASSLERLVISDSIRPSEAVRATDKIRVLSVAPLMGEAISRISSESSVSSLFD